jgi:hypothetical protein
LQRHPHMSAWQHASERRHARQLTGSGCGVSNRADTVVSGTTRPVGPPDGRCCQTGRIRRRCSGPTRGYPERKLSGAFLDLPVRRAGSCDAHSTSPIACQAERGAASSSGWCARGRAVGWDCPGERHQRRGSTADGPNPDASAAVGARPGRRYFRGHSPAPARHAPGLAGPGGDWSGVRVAVCARNSAAEAYDAAVDLLSAPDAPDAIAAMSDEQALGGLRAAAHLGRRVPRRRRRLRVGRHQFRTVRRLDDHRPVAAGPGQHLRAPRPQPDARPPGREHRMEARAAHIHPLTGLTASHRRHPRREAP